MKSINLTIAALLCALICAYAQRPPPAVPTYALTDIGLLPGFTDMGAYAINIHDDVVGAAYNQGPGVRHAFLYRGGRLIDLGTLVGATNDSYAVGINAEGGSSANLLTRPARMVSSTGTAVSRRSTFLTGQRI